MVRLSYFCLHPFDQVNVAGRRIRSYHWRSSQHCPHVASFKPDLRAGQMVTGRLTCCLLCLRSADLRSESGWSAAEDCLSQCGDFNQLAYIGAAAALATP
jgi:hypothetical protein